MKLKAKNETLARVLRHPNGMGFSADGTTHWPRDQFTLRRIRDGDVTLVDDDKPREAPHHAARHLGRANPTRGQREERE
jgi:hypothetical protein